MNYEGGMSLGEIIERLKKEQDLTRRVLLGLGSPGSYRGYYECLGFIPTPNTSIIQMIGCAQRAVGATYDGYKGGEYVMTVDTECYLAVHGDSGPPITSKLLYLLLGVEGKEDEAAKKKGEYCSHPLLTPTEWNQHRPEPCAMATCDCGEYQVCRYCGFKKGQIPCKCTGKPEGGS